MVPPRRAFLELSLKQLVPADGVDALPIENEELLRAFADEKGRPRLCDEAETVGRPGDVGCHRLRHCTRGGWARWGARLDRRLLVGAPHARVPVGVAGRRRRRCGEMWRQHACHPVEKLSGAAKAHFGLLGVRVDIHVLRGDAERDDATWVVTGRQLIAVGERDCPRETAVADCAPVDEKEELPRACSCEMRRCERRVQGDPFALRVDFVQRQLTKHLIGALGQAPRRKILARRSAIRGDEKAKLGMTQRDPLADLEDARALGPTSAGSR